MRFDRQLLETKFNRYFFVLLVVFLFGSLFFRLLLDDEHHPIDPKSFYFYTLESDFPNVEKEEAQGGLSPAHLQLKIASKLIRTSLDNSGRLIDCGLYVDQPEHNPFLYRRVPFCNPAKLNTGEFTILQKYFKRQVNADYFEYYKSWLAEILLSLWYGLFIWLITFSLALISKWANKGK